MTDLPEPDASSGQSRIAKPAVAISTAVPEKSKRRSEPSTITDDLTGKFLRVGNKLYRTSDDKVPIVRIDGERLKTSNLDALPDIIRIARANGWTSIKVKGGDQFKQAAYLAAAAQGLAVEGYTPSKLVKAEAERLQARMAERAARTAGKATGLPKPQSEAQTAKLKLLATRFLSQSHAENARDPDLRRAQNLVAQSMAIARAKYHDDPARAAKEVEARRQDIALRIARGDKIAIIQVRAQQTERIREVVLDQFQSRGGRSC